MQQEIRHPRPRLWVRVRDRRAHNRLQLAVEGLEERSLLSSGLYLPNPAIGALPPSTHQSHVSVHHLAHHVAPRHRVRPAVAHPFRERFVRSAYQQINLVSDFPVGVEGVNAKVQDPHLLNPWGMVINPHGPFWVSDQVTGLSTVYSVGPTPTNPSNVVTTDSLAVTIPPAISQPSLPTPGFLPLTGPTGIVFNNTNSTSDFMLSDGSPALFIFSTLDGQLAAWNGGLFGKPAEIVVPHSVVPTEEFTGLTLGSSGGQNYLYTADPRFPNGIDVFNNKFQMVTNLSPNQFVDPRLPAGFSPYNVQALTVHGVQQIYVAYITPASGGGYIGVFNTDGTFVRQFGNPSRGPLQEPWGMVIAPSDFGRFSNDLLVGNFGDGHISAFNPVTGRYMGQLTTARDQPIVIPFLWALNFGNGNGNGGGAANTLYFTAGIAGQYHGLLGAIQTARL
ncbi:MAG: TIGR03118 family protein [Isosphaeraceae bacterium]